PPARATTRGEGGITERGRDDRGTAAGIDEASGLHGGAWGTPSARPLSADRTELAVYRSGHPPPVWIARMLNSTTATQPPRRARCSPRSSVREPMSQAAGRERNTAGP